MNSSDILAAFRVELSDRKAPYLWSNAEIFGFLDEAQTLFCRETDGIADARTATVTQLAVVAGTDWYTTHSAILNVRKITRADTGREVEMLTAEQADHRGIVFLASRKGPVRYAVMGLEPHAIRLSPMPNEAITLNLSVYRLPLIAITDIGDQALEVDAQHHPHLLHWMKHRAYDKQDVETFDRRKSDEFRDRFMTYCARAKQEQARARRTQAPVAYGGL